MAVLQYGSLIQQVATTVTAAGTTTLTNVSPTIQVFTGTSTQTVVLPVATTFTTSGASFQLFNTSTGAVTVEYQDTTTLFTIPANSTLIVSCVNATTANGVWTTLYNSASSAPGPGSVGNPELAPGLELETLTLTPSGGAIAMNVATANNFYCTLGAPTTLTVNLSNFLDGQVGMLEIAANSNAVTVVFSPAVLWPGGTQPAQSTGTDIYSILWNATTASYYGAVSQNYS